MWCDSSWHALSAHSEELIISQGLCLKDAKNYSLASGLSYIVGALDLARRGLLIQIGRIGSSILLPPSKYADVNNVVYNFPLWRRLLRLTRTTWKVINIWVHWIVYDLYPLIQTLTGNNISKDWGTPSCEFNPDFVNFEVENLMLFPIYLGYVYFPVAQGSTKLKFHREQWLSPRFTVDTFLHCWWFKSE